ncbi:hypothetical protein CQ010_14795 [Arthrobacter sp. MYb211]|uniref:DUF6069 family protein n=1 Tax=Micrococcaceae TaxID=1268 RepID=UPI000BB74C61|nr:MULTISPECIES: DUF6069 family protein [Micrococcaceae]PCC36862.1 hypothetical protein CIK74_03415 [Glutamicibacter sp. BW77]PRA00155.1 hypothetical protein CQ017_03715 [Arthrobacter sp. MYb224]PRA10261.1 hypothetical protein CQ015_14790 [Arthrobacter sp. MYb221]PRC05641.1 hypothetical protein CQ010_14795 [Arthrobacter sp. MYb211]
MSAEMKYKMPFNYVQVVIAAFSAVVTSVFVFFISGVAGGSMRFTGGIFQNVDFFGIVRFIALPFLILGFLTFLIGRARPGFCKFAQWAGAAVMVVSVINPILFAADLASGIGLSLILLVVGASWYMAVDNSNKLARKSKLERLQAKQLRVA